MTLLPQAIVIFSLATGEPHVVALLDYPYQLLDTAFRPKEGEGRLAMDREQFKLDYMAGTYPDPDKLAALARSARERILAAPSVCLAGLDEVP